MLGCKDTATKTFLEDLTSRLIRTSLRLTVCLGQHPHLGEPLTVFHGRAGKPSTNASGRKYPVAYMPTASGPISSMAVERVRRQDVQNGGS